MKYLICSLIALVLTFFLGEILSIYSFGTIPTLLTSLYLISMFLPVINIDNKKTKNGRFLIFFKVNINITAPLPYTGK